jgi:hypothetical protein
MDEGYFEVGSAVGRLLLNQGRASCGRCPGCGSVECPHSPGSRKENKGFTEEKAPILSLAKSLLLYPEPGKLFFQARDKVKQDSCPRKAEA